MTQHPRVTAATVAALTLSCVACGSSSGTNDAGPQDRVQVGGAFGSRPTVQLSTPFSVSTSSSWVSEVGKGEPVGAESTAILQLTLVDGRTGKTAISTLDRGQQPLTVDLSDAVFPSLARALIGKAAEGRVVVASTPEDAYGSKGAPQFGIRASDSVIMVADILATDPTTVLDQPSGAAHTAPASAPRLRNKDGVPVAFDFTLLRKPKKLVVVTLREGTGPVVRSPDRVALDYLGQVWDAKQPFGETYSKEPALYSVGLGRLIKAWEKALVGLKEGARVLLVCPPKLAYGATSRPDIPAGSTLVYLLDVLGVG